MECNILYLGNSSQAFDYHVDDLYQSWSDACIVTMQDHIQRQSPISVPGKCQLSGKHPCIILFGQCSSLYTNECNLYPRYPGHYGIMYIYNINIHCFLSFMYLGLFETYPELYDLLAHIIYTRYT